MELGQERVEIKDSILVLAERLGQSPPCAEFPILASVSGDRLEAARILTREWRCSLAWKETAHEPSADYAIEVARFCTVREKDEPQRRVHFAKTALIFCP